MAKKLLFVVVAVIALLASLGATPASQTGVKKPRPPAGVAGQVSPFRIPTPDLSTLAISGAMGEGVFCAVHKGTNVHSIGYLPAGLTVRIEFESAEASDPLATLLALRFADQGPQVEVAWSDDEGGGLNPVFEVTRDYEAIWILTVSSADGQPACYTYKISVDQKK